MSPVVPSLDRCATCGQPVADTPDCAACGATLAVDVLVTAPVTSPRVAFEAARAVVGLNLPGLDFAAVKAALLSAGRPLASQVTRPAARRLIGTLADTGVSATARAASPGAPAAPPGRRKPGALALAAAGGAVLALSLAGVLLRTASPPAQGRPGLAEPAAQVAVPAPAPGPSGPAAQPARGEPTVAELLRQALPATATVACQGQSGTGFFIEADRLITNAHVICGDHVPLEVTTGDGRQLVGKVEKKDAWFDWAVVTVPGAAVARPLALGDSSALVAGDQVGLIGAPRGLGSTVHEGKVSFVGRNIRGISFLQLNAAVNPGNSGGPVLDATGKVVGIVSLKVNESDGMGMALPVEYLRPALAGQPAPDEAATRRWAELRSRAEAEDAAEVARIRRDLAGPVLVGVASSGPRSIELTVMHRWNGRAGTATVTAEVQRDGQVLCRPTGRVEAWIDLSEREKKAPVKQEDVTTTWLLRNGLLAGVHGGSVEVGLERCPDPLPEGARLRLEGAEGERAWFRMPGPEPVTGHERELWSAKAGAEALRRFEEGEQRATEAGWRQAFKVAREEVAELERRCARYRAELHQPLNTFTLDQARQKLPEDEQRLRAARERLDELERRASRLGIPREWR